MHAVADPLSSSARHYMCKCNSTLYYQAADKVIVSLPTHIPHCANSKISQTHRLTELGMVPTCLSNTELLCTLYIALGTECSPKDNIYMYPHVHIYTCIGLLLSGLYTCTCVHVHIARAMHDFTIIVAV